MNTYFSYLRGKLKRSLWVFYSPCSFSEKQSSSQMKYPILTHSVDHLSNWVSASIHSPSYKIREHLWDEDEIISPSVTLI